MRVPTIKELEAMVEAAKADPKRKRRKATKRTTRRNSKRTNYAAQALAVGWSMVETVKRVNEKPATAIAVDDNAIPWQGETCEMPEWLGEVGL